MPEKQAEIIGNQQNDLIDTNLATKQDIALLRNDMKHGFDLQKTEMDALRKDMTIKLGSMLVIAVGVFALITRF